jgi:hypothetical protein
MDGVRKDRALLTSPASGTATFSRSGGGETFRLTIDRPEAVGLVAASGRDVNEETSLREAARFLIPRESGFPVDVVNEYKDLCTRKSPNVGLFRVH